ncbi:unnamed protein product [Hermetia illucens]|uniref:Uncharacterized protein n=1 Tax=Hermetia illucens TaxID=343691 RepID=A0A7R8UYG7_HERIL|nr:unnamed protein product [Hermetia illucens]
MLSKIGLFYEIARIPQDGTSLRRAKDQFVVFGKHTYDLAHFTAVPQTIVDSELKSCPLQEDIFLGSPKFIKDINHIPNFAVDTMYKRLNKPTCRPDKVECSELTLYKQELLLKPKICLNKNVHIF